MRVSGPLRDEEEAGCIAIEIQGTSEQPAFSETTYFGVRLVPEEQQSIVTIANLADERVMDRMRERRIDLRLLCADIVELIWTDAAGREKRRIGNLEDISSSGMCLQLEIPIEAGTSIRVLYGGGELVGVVRYTVVRDLAYLVGINFDECSRWSGNEFRPQHLLDPADLLQKILMQRTDIGISQRIH